MFSQVQILGYNADLYDNETTASKSPHGLTAISVLLQVGDMSNVEMRKITKAARNIRYGGRIFLILLCNQWLIIISWELYWLLISVLYF